MAALQKLPVNSTETKTPDTNNTNQSAETLKKTAEANASTNGVVNNDQNKNLNKDFLKIIYNQKFNRKFAYLVVANKSVSRNI